ncbi:acyl-CoA thioesterase [Paraburkholderia terricola]|uniref:Acyl-CoA thioester hydrolase n=1 Tax=Paraburkholderia terricola TaxID=169427 RepID=A0ABU1M1T8_9BURK|nr:thioesterase family protein [Paraburkholderia terricola]MDR6412834.1 acyl-CoA thioester hydrolase [Paraburkholderia terricola]MDR6450042.1 acyl-CoA thioester hydrolase [Paraburkholderia terricola]MDR6484894.1 acyl-CoA thioester hydrolase [Paraburkholderia terricola]
MPVSHRLRVRFGECDPMGVVYHPNYLIWFHEARDSFLQQAGIDLQALVRKGYSLPIVDASCSYLRSARYADEITVIAQTTATRVAKLAFEFRIVHDKTGETLATGRTVSVVLDQDGRLLLSLPADMKVLEAPRQPIEAAV